MAAMHKEILQMFDLTGQVSLIIGGARDLGYDMASTLAGAGSHPATRPTGSPAARAG